MTLLLAAVMLLLIARALGRYERRSRHPRFLTPSPEETASLIVLQATSEAIMRHMIYSGPSVDDIDEPWIVIEAMIEARNRARATSPAVLAAFERMESGRLSTVREKLLASIEDLDSKDRNRANRLLGLLNSGGG